MARFLILSSFIIFIIAIDTSAQEIGIDISDQPLNEVLTDLSAKTGLQISFDDKGLSNYRVSLTGYFPDPGSLIKKLLVGLPLEFEIKEQVIVIYPIRKNRKPSTYSITGQVVDRTTREPLPFSHVIINQHGMATDLKGGFAYTAQDSSFDIGVTHLGYYLFDTIVGKPGQVTLMLTPSMIGLKEIEITNSVISRSGLIGQEAGRMKLNHQVAV